MKSILLRLLGFIKPVWTGVALSVFLGFITVACNVGLLATSAYLISAAALHPSIAALQVAIVGVRFFGLSRGVFRYLERLATHSVNFRVLSALRIWLYDRLEPLAPARLIAYQSGDVLARAISDVETLEQFYVRVVAPPLVAVLASMTTWFWLRGFDARLANVLLAFLLITGLVLPILIRRLSRRSGQAVVQARAHLGAALVDSLQGLADLLVFSRHPEVIRKIHALDQVSHRTQVRLAWVAGAQTALSTLVVQLGSWAILALSILLVRSGQVDGVYLAVLVLGSLATFEAVLPLPQAAQHLESSLEAARRLFDLAEQPPAVIDSPGKTSPVETRPVAPLPPAITVRDLVFRYEQDLPPALNGLNLDIPAGKTLALVGPSGSGKTTLINLLLRFWDYSQGEICLDGVEIRSLPAETHRRQISVVSPTTYIFNTTILQNLLLADARASREEVIAAARLAQIHDWIESLPDGYDTWVGERGLRLSGGERQRLAVARAFLKNAPVLILDEPTAHLDAENESCLFRSLASLSRSRTTLLVTHRLAYLAAVDEIAVLKGGQVVERGTHSNLMQLQGAYYRMVKLQPGIVEPD